jgi:hypothetical protein
VIVATPRRHQPWSGARLPTGRNAATVVECFRCAEDRRALLSIRIVHGGTTLGTTLLCAECVTALQPLDPDPLDATSLS